MLPTPTSLRFQPLRSGLINLFKYENQQFWYEHGRLLVRGNNGTGKSRVLALQLPFLLDAEIHPSRVEPDGDPARHIAWHLTMGEYPQRTGYTWIEFGRRDEKGVEHFVTLGCGMKATKDGDNQPTRWFFVTNRRVDLDFDLVADSRPLNAEQLAARIGEDCFPKNAREYRRAVDARLFSLGDERYRALMDLLIRLRAPQLAKKLDEKNLYAALSDSLPPLDADVVAKVAAAFRDLDDLRAQFESLTQLERTIGEFGEDYRRYAQVAVARRAAHLRTAHSTFEKYQRDLAELNRKLTAARLAEESAELAAKGARDAALAAKSNHETLQQSQAAGDAQALGLAATAAQSAERRAKATEEALTQAESNLNKVENELTACESAWNEAETLLDQELAATLQTAHAAGFSQDHMRLLPAQAATWPENTEALKPLRQSLLAAGKAHVRRLDAIDALLAAVADATKHLADAQRAETEASDTVARLRETEQKHDTEARDAGKALVLAYESWRGGLRWLAPDPWADLSEDFELWLETGAEENRGLPSVLEKATSCEAGALATAREQLKTRTTLLAERKATLRRERDELLVGPPPPPLAPPTRDAASRAQRPGLALWQACEFAPHLTAVERAGLEAALEASGLLDAWITPDGLLLADLPADTFFTVHEGEAPTAHRTHGATLADWLHADLPETGAALSPAIVARALASVPAGYAADSSCWVALDGRWRIGPLTGRGQKESAKHLGARSREAARLARLQELEIALTSLANEETQLATESDALASREKTARAERATAPSDDAVASALARRSARRSDLAHARDAFEKACRASEASRSALSTAIATRDRDAAGLGFGEHLARLPELRGSWREHESAMHSLWSAAETRAIRKGLFGESQGRVAGARETCTLCSLQAEEASNEHIAAKAAHEALRARVGATIEEFQLQLETARLAREGSEKALKSAEAAIVDASKHVLELNTKLEPTKRDMEAADAARAEAAQHLRLPLHRGLFFEARPELGDIERDAWSPTRAIEIARRIERELPGTDLDDAGWTHLRNVLETRLTELRNRAGPLGCQARSEVVGQDLSIVVCAYQGVDHTPSSLRAAVASELAERERLLSEKERGIIETHLVSEVSARLQSLIANARDRKDKMNAEMTRCATTLGVTLRLVWEPLDDASVPAGLRPVLKLVLADHGTWTDPERAQVGAFLHQLIKDERQRDAAATWSEQLSRALDYRRWHAFGAERRQNGQWERLTRQRYGTGSGGEKALMLTIPQMAAAASHYRSAAPHAPRLILLDEAFAGMDKPTRAKCMGLLDKEAFDLDLLMTSEREWGAHSTVSGIAIYQLVADAQAIDATRWVWNGRKKRLAPVPDTPEMRAEHPLPVPAATSAPGATPSSDELPLG